jgi:hypothetical protein
MKTSRYILPFVCLALCTLAAAAPKETVLIDLTDVRQDPIREITEKNYEYVYDTWSKKVIDLPGKGALVQAPTGRGGLGENKTMVRFGKTKIIEVYLIVGAANKAQSVRLSLEDKDGTIQNWNMPIGTQPKGDLLKFTLDLEKSSDEEKSGKTPGLDRNKIYSWQLKGDWQDANVEVLFIKIVGLKD